MTKCSRRCSCSCWRLFACKEENRPIRHTPNTKEKMNKKNGANWHRLNATHLMNVETREWQDYDHQNVLSSFIFCPWDKRFLLSPLIWSRILGGWPIFDWMGFQCAIERWVFFCVEIFLAFLSIFVQFAVSTYRWRATYTIMTFLVRYLFDIHICRNLSIADILSVASICLNSVVD